MLASAVKIEAAGNAAYQSEHMGKIFKEGFSFSGFERDKLYLNDRGGRFIDISGLSGLDSVSDGRGAAYADFDNDGDYDVFLSALQGQVHYLFRNNIGQDRAFVRLSLEGTASGRDAYGAEVRLKTSQGILTRIKAGGSGFVSQSDPRLLFGLGAEKAAQWLEVRWPSGAVQRFEHIPAGASLRLVEGNSTLEYLEEKRFVLPGPAAVDAPVLRALRHGPGELFPALKMVDLSGGSTDFQRYRRPDRAYLVNFWATYCAPCRREMPELQKLAPRLKEAGVELIGISLDQGAGRGKIPAFLKKLGVDYPVFTTDQAAFEQIFSGDEVFIPLSFLVDRRGRVAEVFAGWSAQTERKLKSLIAFSAEKKP